MPATIEYFVFLMSPWAYLGSERFAAMVQRHGASVRVRPIDAGQVFPASGGLPLAKRAPQRQAYRLVELRRWSQFLQMPFNLHPKHFPVPDGQAARATVALREQGKDAMGFAHACMRAVWAEDRDLSDPATVAAILREQGHDPAALLAAAETPAISAAQQADTELALSLQVFGAPSYVLNGEIFWGQDRLDFLERALQKI